jgi:hypothetical protein
MKKWILSLMVLTMALTLNAAPVDRSDALTVASNFVRLSLEEKLRGDIPLNYVDWNAQQSLSNLYLFVGDHCFVILSADDRAFPILGYSLENDFDASFIPANVLEWLQMYHQGIQDLKEQGVEATREVKDSWKCLIDGVLPSAEERAEVAPLIATRWGQHEPYNYYCPAECLTGCVSTTMSQIMRYYEYPNHGVGSHSYTTSNYGTLSANFAQTTYDWDHMPLTASSDSPVEVKQALGTLFFQCGVSVDMDYSPDGSAAFSTEVPDVMKTYFNYASDITLKDKVDFTQSGWENLIKGELNAARPVYFSASGNVGGHAFLCDGYDARNYFHMNWGWSGNHDGYYQLGALNPDEETHYNNSNRIIIHIHPKEYAISAPSSLNLNCDDGWIHLSWPAVSGAAYYKVYRDDEVLDGHVTATRYDDYNFSYGEHDYYVKAVTSAGDRSPRSESVGVIVEYALPEPTAIEAQIRHDDGDYVLLTWEMPTLGEAQLYYGAPESPYSGSGYNGYDTYWAQRYPRRTVEALAGMVISEVQVYFREPGTYTVYVCNGDPINPEAIMYQQNYVCTSEGWNSIILQTPVDLDYTNDFWVMLFAPASISYPAAFCDYSGDGLVDACYIRKAGGGWYSYYEDSRSWLIKVIVKDKDFTYAIAKNDYIIAENVSERIYADRDLEPGLMEYYVMASDGTNDSYWSESVFLKIHRIQAESNSSAMGSVSGQGLYANNEQAVLKATANPGYHFVSWKENGVTVSTNTTYTFTVNSERTITAYFEVGHGVEEYEASVEVTPNPVSGKFRVESSSWIRQMELVTLEGTVVASQQVEGHNAEWNLGNYAQGMYLLRLVTDAGVIVKRLIVNE